MRWSAHKDHAETRGSKRSDKYSSIEKLQDGELEQEEVENYKPRDGANRSHVVASVDGFCIKKSDSSELSEAIVSMLRWYRSATKCFVYLSAVSTEGVGHLDPPSWEPAFRKSKWFTRGWTLQELLAPRSVEFFCSKGFRLGDKRSLEGQLHEITGIAVSALRGDPLSGFGAEERMSWAKNRENKREEDTAYSLLGIFDVFMLPMYGEGRDNALDRLRDEIAKRSKKYRHRDEPVVLPDVERAHTLNNRSITVPCNGNSEFKDCMHRVNSQRPATPLDSLSVAVDAPFNSYSTQHEPTCLSGTRVDLLREIYEWAERLDGRGIFWLNGLAGTGKSTIARSVARTCFEKKCLGASFFFSRGGGDAGHAKKFKICDAITERGNVASRSLRDQWHHLVLRPLSKLEYNRTKPWYLLVIDALDECDDDSNIQIILSLLAEARSSKKVHLCEDSNFRVNKERSHEDLAHSCMQLMSKTLKQDICNLETPGMLVAGIDGGRVERSLPLDVQYACLYWIQHLQECGAEPRDNDQVHQFLQKHLLHWFEALGWMRKVSEGIHAIMSLESLARHSNCPRLSTFVHDAKRFFLCNRSAIEQAPLQIYFSALIFAPTNSIIKQQFKDYIPRWIRSLLSVESNWNALLRTLEGHSNVVTAVSFSPDGKIPAWASHVNTVLLWDASSGAACQTLEGLTAEITAIAFSPDGKTLASASYDQTVKLWDPILGSVKQRLKEHSGPVIIITFSPHGKRLASASRERTVRLWDTSLGTVLQTIQGHSNGVKAIVWSLDGKRLAATCHNSTVLLWDADSDRVFQTFKGHSGSVSAIAFSPDGKTLVSASNDGTVKIRDASLDAVLQNLVEHSDVVEAIAFSVDGKMIASA
ncbi:MAG: hypothetical protein FE78DRAFT_66524 [Acidomyces sp. 'richmondensis']|nr:MAG: hypothetical protein FE78DRAFT_66524 [Acidomyces sp. 'richmondensis']